MIERARIAVLLGTIGFVRVIETIVPPVASPFVGNATSAAVACGRTLFPQCVWPIRRPGVGGGRRGRAAKKRGASRNIIGTIDLVGVVPTVLLVVASPFFPHAFDRADDFNVGGFCRRQDAGEFRLLALGNVDGGGGAVGLVAPVVAIPQSVADEFATQAFLRGLRVRSGAKVIRIGAVELAAILFVGSVAAVVVLVANVVLRDAVMIFAGEVVDGTSGIIAIVRFVRSVDAIFVQIAFPRFRNTAPRRHAPKLFGGTVLLGASLGLFVFRVFAVVVAVAEPSQGDAAVVGAAVLVFVATVLEADAALRVVLVGFVATIVVAVA